MRVDALVIANRRRETPEHVRVKQLGLEATDHVEEILQRPDAT